jgi:dihydropteroate synthase
MNRPIYELTCHRTQIRLGQTTRIMGILNTTPDSFSDGGKYLDPIKALDRALEMIDEGADIIDIGGESSRPAGPYGKGASDISLEEELQRTVPIIEKLAARVTTPISIDTTKSEVAQRAIESGASIVNDISALRFDAQMAKVIAANRVPVVLMHMKGTPKTMQQNPRYRDVIAEINCFFKAQINKALGAGIPMDNIIIDPGFGFGKGYAHNIQILAQLGHFHALCCPILVGPSRKQFTGPHATSGDRLPGTIAALSQCILSGAHIVRVHDVLETRQAAKLIDRVQSCLPFNSLTNDREPS